MEQEDTDYQGQQANELYEMIIEALLECKAKGVSKQNLKTLCFECGVQFNKI